MLDVWLIIVSPQSRILYYSEFLAILTGEINDMFDLLSNGGLDSGQIRDVLERSADATRTKITR